MALRKPTRTYKGRDRQIVRKLLNAVKSMQARDSRVSNAVVPEGTTKFYFGGDDAPGAATAMQTLKNRCQAVLALVS